MSRSRPTNNAETNNPHANRNNFTHRKLLRLLEEKEQPRVEVHKRINEQWAYTPDPEEYEETTVLRTRYTGYDLLPPGTVKPELPSIQVINDERRFITPYQFPYSDTFQQHEGGPVFVANSDDIQTLQYVAAAIKHIHSLTPGGTPTGNRNRLYFNADTCYFDPQHPSYFGSFVLDVYGNKSQIPTDIVDTADKLCGEVTAEPENTSSGATPILLLTALLIAALAGYYLYQDRRRRRGEYQEVALGEHKEEQRLQM